MGPSSTGIGASRPEAPRSLGERTQATQAPQRAEQSAQKHEKTLAGTNDLPGRSTHSLTQQPCGAPAKKRSHTSKEQLRQRGTLGRPLCSQGVQCFPNMANQ